MVARKLASRYELEELISQGDLGAVWRATDETLHRVVAVKLLELDEAIPDATEQFRSEAQAAASLVHPNIVTVFDYGIDGSTAYVVMELLAGPTLAEQLANSGPLQLDEVLLIAAQVCSALKAAHAAGIVHRDLKPGNIEHASRDLVKVLDFGVARLVEATSTIIAPTLGVVEAAHYLAPEQVLGHPTDARTDLYALGCVLMALLTGRPPFAGEDSLAVGSGHVETSPPRLDELRAGLPASLDELVARLLAKDPMGRPSSAEEVRQRLSEIGASLAAEVPPSLDEPTIALAVAESSPPTLELGAISPTEGLVAGAASGTPRFLPTRRLVLVAVLAMALLGIALGLVFTASNDKAPTDNRARHSNSGSASSTTSSSTTTTTASTTTSPNSTTTSAPGTVNNSTTTTVPRKSVASTSSTLPPASTVPASTVPASTVATTVPTSTSPPTTVPPST